MSVAKCVTFLLTAGDAVSSEFSLRFHQWAIFGTSETYGVERFERMRRLRLIGDLIASATVETSNNRSARRRRFAGAMATRDASVFPLVLGMFAGPESIPSGLVNEGVLDLVRAA